MYRTDDPCSSPGGAGLAERSLGWDEKQHALARGRQLQAEAINRALRAGADVLLRLVRAVVIAPLRGRRRRRTDASTLLGLNDRLLADIGLRRGDVQGIAYGVIPVAQLTPAKRAQQPATTAEVTVLRFKRPDRDSSRDLNAAA